MLRRLSLLFCGFAFASVSLAKVVVVADSPPAANLHELDQQLTALFQASAVPGASVAVIENGAVVLSKGYGLADVAARRPVTTDTVFRAGSISKSIVGIAVMMLVEEGKLDLNAKLADLAPEVKFSNPWEATNPVRLVNLLEHTAGFDDLRPSQYLLDGRDMPLADAIQVLGPYASRWKPGTYMSYSNPGPVIAAYIVEKVSGLSWAEFTRQRIFKPLGMTSAHWDRSPAFAARLAKSYRPDGVTEFPYTDIAGKPAGGLNATARDLAQVALMLVGRGSLNGVSLLKPASVARIETPESTLASRLGLKLGYGLGNQADGREKAVFHGHEGSIDAFEAYYSYQPQHAAGLVVMLNGHQESILEAVELITSYLQRTWAAPVSSELKPATRELEALTGFYQQAVPRQQWMAPMYRLLDWSRMRLENGQLEFNGVARKQVAPGIFQRTDLAAPTIVFTTTAEGLLSLTGEGAQRRVPGAEVAAKATFAGVYALSLLSSLVLALFWIVARLRGRPRARAISSVHWLPTLALLVPLGFAINLMTADLQALATASPSAMLICGLSLMIPVTGIAALVAAVNAPRDTRRPIRLLAWASTALTLTASVYLGQYGWLGLRTWL